MNTAASLDDLSHVRIRATDPPEVFDEVAKLLTQYRPGIKRAAENIIARFPGEPPRAAASAFVASIAKNIADPFIAGAVTELARAEFKLRGVL
jgi:hypothetical protein